MKRTYIAPESSTVFCFSQTDFMGIGGSTGTGWGFGKEDGFDFEDCTVRSGQQASLGTSAVVSARRSGSSVTATKLLEIRRE